MLRHLVLIRHAKSSWDNPDLPDLERPLTPRGERNAPLMGHELKARGIRPELIISSPAVRARLTAELLAEQLDYSPEEIRIDSDLYEKGPDTLEERIQNLDDRWKCVFLVGHNPDFQTLVNRLTGENMTHLPTCGVVSITFVTESWLHIMPGSGRLEFFDYPKRHKHHH